MKINGKNCPDKEKKATVNVTLKLSSFSSIKLTADPVRSASPCLASQYYVGRGWMIQVEGQPGLHCLTSRGEREMDGNGLG